MNIFRILLTITLLTLAAQVAVADGLAPENGLGTTQQEAPDAARAGLDTDAALTIERARGARLAGAMGHYARSRALLLEALREFDTARNMARPDAVLDSDLWRETVVTRIEELQILLDPQPRASKSGVRLSGDRRILSKGTP